MPNDPDEFDINILQAAVDHYRTNRPPVDIEPRKPLTREDILDLDAAAGTTTTIRHPGQMILDPDGLPVGMTASHTTHDTIAPPILRRTVLDQAGLTPEEVPNVRIID